MAATTNSIKLRAEPYKWSSNVTVKLTDEDIIPSNLSTAGKITWITNKMWHYESNGEHLKAEYWRRELEKVKSTSAKSKRKKMKKFHKSENQKLKTEFESRCKILSDSYTKKLEKLNAESVELIENLKAHQSEDRKVLNYALKTNYGNVGINKQILHLRQMEYACGQAQKFIEAQRIKEEIEILQSQRVNKHFQNQLKRDELAKEKLEVEHKKEMDRLLAKIDVKKKQLYHELETELMKLESWKAGQDKRMKTEHHKDMLKLDNKLLSQAPPKGEQRISHILHDDDFLIQSRTISVDSNIKNKRARFQRSLNWKFLAQSHEQMDAENAGFEKKRNKQLDSKRSRRRKTRKSVALSGIFKQYIEGDDAQSWYLVKVEIDRKREEIRWKLKNTKGLYQDKEYEMMIECKILFENILDIQGPSLCGIFDEKNGFVTERCFSILGTSMKLHLEADNESAMRQFVQKLKQIVQSRRRTL